MAVISKIISKIKVSFMKTYDWLILASIVTAFIQTICVIAACKHGLGQHRRAIPADEFDTFSKYVYAADLLFIVANALAKASLVAFVMVIAPQRRIQLSCYTLLAVVAGWAVSGIFARAFQCQTPQRWVHADGKCHGEKATSLYLGIVNILTDIALIVLPSLMMVISLFASRAIVPIFVVFQLVQYQKLYDSDDRSWKMVGAAIWSQLVMNLSILTACIPSLKTVLDMFRSGTSFFTVPAQYQTSVDNSSGGLRSRIANAISNRFTSGRSVSRSQKHTSRSAAEWPTKQMKAVSGQHSVNVTSTAREQVDAKGVPQRSESQTNLTPNEIMRTVAYEVEYEDGSVTQPTGVSDVHSGTSMNSEGQHSY
ncbi:hypothetical protein H2200_003908 [Cladophialophora chaetospira]|uniref:Rhodopsin domain-containing protein n=1 Tax=Cladophialophora chaetospira TaxID=386627 RepID=A0AA38XFB4_9EURO|nr:hypothetical protein H2200_003908 [Cladophialophora chaetospira]